MLRFQFRCVGLAFALLVSVRLLAQEPLDLFADAPALDTGFVRLAAWNVRHIELTDRAGRLLAGNSREEKYASLVATFAKAIQDLKLDLLVVVEHQPRRGEPDRLRQLLECLNQGDDGPWRVDETAIEYDDPDDPYGNLQFAVFWNVAKGIAIVPAQNQLLENLRQPRDSAGQLVNRQTRIPWLVPVEIGGEVNGSIGTGPLRFDLLALHFKSGSGPPQNAEVDAVARFIQQHQRATPRRHLIVCGDWNIRPDQDPQGAGRSRLRKMTIPTADGPLMRILTLGEIRPTLDEWNALEQQVGTISRFPALAPLLPFSHYNVGNPGFDTLLDHIAISRTLDELFDHPLQVTLADGTRDLRPGIEIVRPMISEEKYDSLTDHLPVVLTLRVASDPPPQPSLRRVRIIAAEPNPLGDETVFEEVHLKNVSGQTVELRGWQIRNAAGKNWTIGDEDDATLNNGRLFRGRTAVIRRQGRPMTLHNSGDTIALFDKEGNLIDVQTYTQAPSGELLRFD